MAVFPKIDSLEVAMFADEDAAPLWLRAQA
jgi:hypothetical protein